MKFPEIGLLRKKPENGTIPSRGNPVKSIRVLIPEIKSELAQQQWMSSTWNRNCRKIDSRKDLKFWPMKKEENQENFRSVFLKKKKRQPEKTISSDSVCLFGLFAPFHIFASL